ncbi:putative membrane protein, partial [Yersinia pestis PY-103]
RADEDYMMIRFFHFIYFSLIGLTILWCVLYGGFN